MKKFVVLSLLVMAIVTGTASCRKKTPPAAGPTPVPETVDRVPADFLKRITQEDIALLLKDMPREQLESLGNDKAKRQEMLKQLREILSGAVEAFNTGMADSAEVKDQLALVRSLAIAQAYMSSKQTPGAPPIDPVKPEEIDAYLKQPGVEAKFDSFMKTAKAAKLAPEEIPAEQRTPMMRDWAKLMIAGERAGKEGFGEQRAAKLQVTMQQAQFLAQKFANEKFADQARATDAEIAEYLSKHPELDTSKARAKAEDLLRRARSGEDFAKLARENTDDPGSKDSGGFYDWFARGKMVKEFEDSAFSLKVGEISNLVETQYGYHIIKLEGKRTQKNPDTGKDEEQVQVRHILISTKTPADPANPGAQPMSPREKAKTEIEKQKKDRILSDIVARSGVSVPDDFEVKVPPPQPGASPEVPTGTGPR